MQVQILTDLTSEPVTLDEVRKYLRITTTSEDDLLTSLIKSARTRLEKFSNLSFGAKEIQVYFNELWDWQELPYQPNATITSVKDNDNVTLVYEERGTPYKSIKTQSSNGVIVIYTVDGFINDAIKEAIKKEVYTAYENRENYAFNSVSVLDNQARMLVQPFSRMTFLGI